MKHTSFILLVLFGWVNLNAQVLPENDTALTVIRAVYEQIRNAVGDNSRELPEILLLDRQKSVAAYRKADNTLILEKKAYALCQSFGTKANDALAYLIGHEFTHFYQQHQWEEAGFGTSFLVSGNTFQSHIHDEKEADTYGAFIAYLAGYNVVDIIPPLLDAIYQAYEFEEEELHNYPSLAERKKVVAEVCEKVQTLIQVYETANYFIALGKYAWAADCYQYLLQFVKYKELYNNLGTALLSEAYSLLPDDALPFAYPLQIDLNIPLRRPADADRVQLIEQSIAYLNIAINYDPSYHRAFINLACAYDLAGHYEQSLELLAKLEKVAKLSKIKAQIKLVKGIVLAHKGELQPASNYFDEAVKEYEGTDIRQTVEHNKKVLKNKVRPKINFPQPAQLDEQIEQLNLRYKRDHHFDKNITFQGSDPLFPESLQIKYLPHSTLIQFEAAGQSMALHRTGHISQKTANDIKAGDSLMALQKAYQGKSFKILTHSKGYFFVIPEESLVFNINANGQVHEWAVYAIY